MKAGVSGIIVSNHGARNLDTVPATIQALPRISEKIERRIPLLVDGGIRRGTDVLKALALGATAVQIGRPYLWGLGVAGAGRRDASGADPKARVRTGDDAQWTSDAREHRSVADLAGLNEDPRLALDGDQRIVGVSAA